MVGLQKILLVEDDPQISEIYSTVLRTQGYQIVVAANYDDALAQAKTFVPDLIFLDVMIPGKSGLDVMRALRSDPQYNCQQKKIVLLTNLGENQEVGEALAKNQVDGYVIKADISANDLDDIIKSFDNLPKPPPPPIASVPVQPPKI
jgi:CheY-like chemotaxis protein